MRRPLPPGGLPTGLRVVGYWNLCIFEDRVSGTAALPFFDNLVFLQEWHLLLGICGPDLFGWVPCLLSIPLLKTSGIEVGEVGQLLTDSSSRCL